MQVLASAQLTGDETGCFTSDLHHQWCIVTTVGAPQEISWSSASYVTWWIWSSGIALNIGSRKGEILLEDNETWHNGVCHQSCIDFLKVDPSRHAKENILLLTDTFTKFSQSFVMNNQKALTFAKILVNKWFYIYGILAHIHSNKGQSWKMLQSPSCTPCTISSSLWPSLTILVKFHLWEI